MADSRMSFDQFVDFVNVFGGERPKHLRLGQWAYNVLWEQFPAIARAVVVQEPTVDPFYRDELMPAFLAYLLQHHVDAPPNIANRERTDG